MNPRDIDLPVVSTYLHLETVAFMIGIIISFVNVVFVVVGKDKNVYIFLAIRTVLSLGADFLLIPNFGVYGVAISNIIVNTILTFASIALLYIQKYIKICRFRKSDCSIKEWYKTGFFSGLQQFIDNFFLCYYDLQNGQHGCKTRRLLECEQFYLGLAFNSNNGTR